MASLASHLFGYHQDGCLLIWALLLVDIVLREAFGPEDLRCISTSPEYRQLTGGIQLLRETEKRRWTAHHLESSHIRNPGIVIGTI
jgi:hypothetical protein